MNPQAKPSRIEVVGIEIGRSTQSRRRGECWRIEESGSKSASAVLSRESADSESVDWVVSRIQVPGNSALLVCLMDFIARDEATFSIPKN